jgi:hypothetical protein
VLSGLYLFNPFVLILIIPPVFYGVKTLAYGYCAFYAYQLRARIVGAEPIAE